MCLCGLRFKKHISQARRALIGQLSSALWLEYALSIAPRKQYHVCTMIGETTNNKHYSTLLKTCVWIVSGNDWFYLFPIWEVRINKILSFLQVHNLINYHSNVTWREYRSRILKNANMFYYINILFTFCNLSHLSLVLITFNVWTDKSCFNHTLGNPSNLRY